MKIRLIAFIALSTVMAAPATAAPSAFWTFGFYFPNKADHRAGGFAGVEDNSGRPVRVALSRVIDTDMTAKVSYAELPFLATATTRLW